jgi:hypothetical protein
VERGDVEDEIEKWGNMIGTRMLIHWELTTRGQKGKDCDDKEETSEMDLA